MKKVVTVTSQGQITIPASMRKQLNLNNSKELILTFLNGKVTMEPTKDIYQLQGALENNLLVKQKQLEYEAKKLTTQQVLKLQEKQAEKQIVKESNLPAQAGK